MSGGLITIPKHYVSDWSQGHGTHWAEISPYDPADTLNYKPYPPGGIFVNGEWVARYTRASYYGKIQTMPRFVLSARDGFDVEVPVTLNRGGGYYFSVALYNGEASYFGLYFGLNEEQGGGLVYCHNAGYGGFEQNVHGLYIMLTDYGWWVKGDKLYAKIVCDPQAGQTRLYARNETKDPGGEYILMWVRYHEILSSGDPRLGVSGPGLVQEGNGSISGSGTADFRWLDPCSLWISGSSFATGPVTPPWNVDIHPITINQYGDEEVLGGAGSFYPWSRYWNPQPSGFNLWPQEFDPYIMKETQEAALQPEGLAPYYVDEYEWGLAHFQSSWFYGVSPAIARDNKAWSTLRLYGRETAYTGSPYQSGTVKVEILDAVTQQPITIDGVSEWHPDSGAFVPLEVDLSAVTAPEIQLRFTLLSDEGTDIIYNGGWVYGAVTPILYGFVVTGTLPFTPPAGSYQEAQTVTLFDPAGGLIVYTTDGSDPREYFDTDGGLALFDTDGELITRGDVR